MALYSSFVHSHGPYELERSIPTTTLTAQAVGEAMMVTSGVAVSATSGNNILGVCVEKKLVTDSGTGPIQIFKLYTGRTEFYGTASTSTFNANRLGTPVDLNNSTTILVATNSNHDFAISQILPGSTDVSGSFRLRIFQ